MKKTLAFTLALALIASIFISCSSANSATPLASKQMAMEYSGAVPAPSAAPSAGFAGRNMLDRPVTEEAEYDMAASDIAPVPPEAGGGIAGPSVNRVMDSRKIIKNVTLQLQTVTFDAAVDSVARIAESFGGFVQNSYVEGRDIYDERGARAAHFTIRVPSETLDSFVNSFGGDEFNVISKSQNSDDITESYYDSKARLDALKIQEERLLSMLESATELEYLLQVEKELMNVRYEIESITSSLNRMDSYVSLSTVNIALSEVVKYEPLKDVPINFSERISRAFASSWVRFSEFSQNFAVVLVESLPFLLLLLVIALIIVLIIKKSRKNTVRREKNTVQAPPAYMPPKFDTAPPPHPENKSPQDDNNK